MKCALIHDWLITEGGSEKVLKALLEIVEGPIYTLFQQRQQGLFCGRKVFTSFLQKIPSIEKYYRNALPLFPFAIRSFDLSPYDLILSSSHCVAKSVCLRKGQIHISYCHTPMRYAWELPGVHPPFWKKACAMPFLIPLRKFDYRTSAGVNYWIANSTHIAHRIQTYYQRKSYVIHPPVDTHLCFISSNREDYYFNGSRFVSSKRLDLLLEVFARLPDRRLFLAGMGPEEKKLRKKATSNVFFLGFLPDEKYREVLSRARAFLHAGEEDFGIALAEAQSCGVPVIAYGKGGSRDIILPGKTGLFFEDQTIGSILSSLREFERIEGQFIPKDIREHAEKFSKKNFLCKMREFIQSVCSEGKLIASYR